jgi:hypothetical protein
MPVNFDFVIFFVFGLVVGLIVLGGVTLAWLVKPRKTVSSGLQTGSDGATHAIPGEGHVLAEDCMCNPQSSGLAGGLFVPTSRFVEHRALGTVRR